VQITEFSELDQVLEGLEIVVAEEVLALREAMKSGAKLSPAIIAAGYLDSSCGGGEELSHQEHATGLACMMGFALYWLACREDSQ
jgi:hypothetical protein